FRLPIAIAAPVRGRLFGSFRRMTPCVRPGSALVSDYSAKVRYWLPRKPYGATEVDRSVRQEREGLSPFPDLERSRSSPDHPRGDQASPVSFRVRLKAAPLRVRAGA